ncbi:terminase [Sciscionella sediminilitoris]|uniref:terminase n=1 Tax=Sciscionella sediminilitoris TaxID=1445613 RepID=UPI00055C2332|nr:terminase [Sciscionella sp. SE31]
MAAKPVERLATMPQGEPALTLGYEAALWAMRNLVQPNGPRAGRRWEPTGSQLHFLLWWYALDEDGRWLFHHGVRRLSKGSGKSPFAAVLGLIEFCAPVRLADFDQRVRGGCVGQPVNMPWVQIVATAEPQTFNTMRMVRAMAPKGSPVVGKYALDPGKTKYYKEPEGTLEVKTSSADAAEGAEASFVIADETEHWKPGNGGPVLAATLQDNLAKSGNRMLETSNAWEPDRGSVAEETYAAWCAQEEGRVRAETRILYDARIAPPDTNLADDESLTKALRWVYDDCYWQDLHPIKQRIWSVNSRIDDSKRKYLNWPTAAEDSWLEQPEAWLAMADASVTVPDGTPVVLFFDGSKSNDATALLGCVVESGHVFTLGVWEPDRRDPNATVDAAAVDAVVRVVFGRFEVCAFFADVAEFQGFVLGEWPQRYGGDLMLWAAPSSRPPQPIAWDMRSHKDEFAKAAETCHAEIMEGAFTHDGDSRVARHVRNARARPYRAMTSVGKDSRHSPRKIDAAVCVIGVRMVRRMVLGSKAWAQRTQKRDRRVLVFR